MIKLNVCHTSVTMATASIHYAWQCSDAAIMTGTIVPPRCHGRFVPNLVAVSFILTAGLTCGAPVFGQGSGEMPPEIREHYPTIIRAQAVLIQIPQMIMQDQALRAEHLAFGDALVEAMIAQDADTARRLERFDDLQRQAESSPGSQDALLQEGRRLRDTLLATAAIALSRPVVSAAAEPLIASLTEAFERLEGVDSETLSIVTDKELLLETVTAMTVFGR